MMEKVSLAVKRKFCKYDQMEKISCIVVDDEPEAREGVARLANADNEVNVTGICANGLEALQLIHEQPPALLLLDIQMPRINGFELLNSLPEGQRPEVIFITAYDEYTLKAFEVHAVDYLLKPFTDERFYRALQFAKDRIRQRVLQKQQQGLNELLIQQREQAERAREGCVVPSEANAKRLAIKTEGRVHMLPYEDIVWIEAYDYYVKIHTEERFFLLRESMKNMEKSLPEQQFVRVHKSSIINLQKVKNLGRNEQGEYELELIPGQLLKVSRNYRDRIRKKLGA